MRGKLSRQGIGLIEVMVALGVTMMGTLAVSTFITQSAKQSAQVETKAKASLTRSLIQQLVANNSTCSTAFKKGADAQTPALVSLAKPVDVPQGNEALRSIFLGQTKVLEVDAAVPGIPSLITSELTFIRKGAPQLIAGSGNHWQTPFELKLTLKPTNSDNVLLVQNESYLIQIETAGTADSDYTPILGCSSPQSVAQQCFAAGGINYDANQNPPCLFQKLAFDSDFALRDARIAGLPNSGGISTSGSLVHGVPVTGSGSIASSLPMEQWPQFSSAAPNAGLRADGFVGEMKTFEGDASYFGMRLTPTPAPNPNQSHDTVIAYGSDLNAAHPNTGDRLVFAFKDRSQKIHEVANARYGIDSVFGVTARVQVGNNTDVLHPTTESVALRLHQYFGLNAAGNAEYADHAIASSKKDVCGLLASCENRALHFLVSDIRKNGVQTPGILDVRRNACLPTQSEAECSRDLAAVKIRSAVTEMSGNLEVKGAIKLGQQSAPPCDSTQAGKIIFDQTVHAPKVCTGSQWITFGVVQTVRVESSCTCDGSGTPVGCSLCTTENTGPGLTRSEQIVSCPAGHKAIGGSALSQGTRESSSEYINETSVSCKARSHDAGDTGIHTICVAVCSPS